MQTDSTIVVTGAAGFIGSCLVSFLNEKGLANLILVDDFSVERKAANLAGKRFAQKIERDIFFDKIEKDNTKIDFVFHLGARTDTTEFDYAVHEKLNVNYSKAMWAYCSKNEIPLVYASSAATYGDGALGYTDDHDLVNELAPLNPYGISKNEFDKWALQQKVQPPFWTGLKFFNVYGPNEYHKGRMASVIFHACRQIKESGGVKLFRSHKDGFKDGEQLRDFIYVKDVLDVCFWMLLHCGKIENGLYNLGTGKARTFNDLVTATFAGLHLQPNIEYIDMPQDLQSTYQYFTEANMNKLIKAGYSKGFYPLEKGVIDYVENYLAGDCYY